MIAYSSVTFLIVIDGIMVSDVTYEQVDENNVGRIDEHLLLHPASLTGSIAGRHP